MRFGILRRVKEFGILCRMLRVDQCNDGLKYEETPKLKRSKGARKVGISLGWVHRTIKQIWTGATMVQLVQREGGLWHHSLHLTTQTAQGSGLCPSCRTSFHSLPLLAALPQCRRWSCSDRLNLFCLPLGCQSFAGERSDQMGDDCSQHPKRYSTR